MSMKQNIEIDGKQVSFKASVAIPRIYRMKFHRDIYKDLRSLEKSVGDGSEENSNLDMFSLEMFENIAYIMAKHADPAIPESPEDWIDGFNTFSIYQVLPQLIQLWGLNTAADVDSKKNFAQLSGKWQPHYSCFDAYSLVFPSVIWICLRLGWSMICSQKAGMMIISTERLRLRRILIDFK